MGLLTPKTRAFHRIGDRYANFFDTDHFLGRSAFEESWVTEPPTNVKEKEGLVSLEIALPGFTKDEVFVELKDDMLHIAAEKKHNEERGYIEREVPDKIAARVIQLSADVDQDKISAHLENGMLYIDIPHTNQPTHLSKSIAVE